MIKCKTSLRNQCPWLWFKTHATIDGKTLTTVSQIIQILGKKKVDFAMPQFDNYNPKQWHFEMSTHPKIIKPNLQTYNQNFKMQNT